jgi:hypothetical protein
MGGERRRRGDENDLYGALLVRELLTRHERLKGLITLRLPTVKFGLF